MPDEYAVARDLAIEAITSTIVDVPTMRRHKLSQTSVTAQSYVIVRLRLRNGVEGIGEAATLGARAGLRKASRRSRPISTAISPPR
jgi:muconate cycloisomerase